MKNSLKTLFYTCLFSTLLYLCGSYLMGASAYAQSISLDLGGDGKAVSSQIIQLVALLTVLSLAPSILIMVTSFTRIIVVLSFLRSALGLQQSPPNTVLISLALFLTAYIMSPTFTKAYEEGIKPYTHEEIDEMEAFNLTTKPFHEFMMKNVREKDLLLFLDLGEVKNVTEVKDVPLFSLVPAFLISELRRAFEIGFILFIPFLIIDIVVASILMSMGMMMVPPVMISLPFKIIFFVLVDGWYLVAGSLAQSYN